MSGSYTGAYNAMKKKPGENASARLVPTGNIDDAWWDDYSKKMQEGRAGAQQPAAGSQHLWDRNKASRYIQQGEIEGGRDLRKNTGRFVNVSWDPRSWVTPLLGKQVDNKWLQSQAAKQHENPVEASRHAAYTRAITQGAGEHLERQAGRASAGMHIAGNAWEGSLPGMIIDPALQAFGKGNYTQAVTGRTTSEHARDYGKEAGGKAEKWLRAAGFGTYAGTSALSFMAGGKILGAAKPFTASHKLAQPAMGALSTARFTEPMAGSATKMMGMFGEDAEQSMSGVSNFIRTVPLYSGVSSALGLAGTALAGTGTGAAAIKSITGAKAMQPVMSFMRWSKAPVELGGRRVLGSLEWLARRSGKLAVWDVTYGPMFGMTSFIVDAAMGKKPKPTQYLLSGSILANSAVSIGASAINASDTLAPMLHSGDGARKHAELMRSIESDADVLEGIRAQYGQADMTVEKAKEVATAEAVGMRSEAVHWHALELLDGKANWKDMTDEQYEQHLASFGPEKLAEAKYNAYRNDVVRGGPVDGMAFTDRSLPREQREKLLELYIRSEDDQHGGTLVGQKLRSVFKGKASIAKDAMNVSDDARQAVLAYASGVVADILEDPSGNSMMDKTSLAVLDEFGHLELKDMMTPLLSATPRQLLDLQQAGKLGAIPDRARDAAEEVMMDRLQHDGNFTAEFIPLFVGGLKDGQNISEKDASRWLTLLSGVDVNKMLSNMDDSKFYGLMRYFASEKGQSALSGLGEGQLQGITESVKSAAGARMRQAFARNPLGTAQMASSLWLASKGWDTMADAATNPLLFYGALTLLVGGSVWLGSRLFGGDSDSGDDEYTGLGLPDWQDDASLLSRRDRQHSLMSND